MKGVENWIYQVFKTFYTKYASKLISLNENKNSKIPLIFGQQFI